MWTSKNRAHRRQSEIGRFCGDFRRLIPGFLVSVGIRRLWRRFSAPGLCIQKFRSRRPEGDGEND